VFGRISEKEKGDVMKLLGRVWLFIGLAVTATTLQAQDSQVSGQIRDASQAAVAGAKVALTHVENGDRREVTSGTEGYYSFPLLVPGHYDLTVEKAGFETETQTGIVVRTGSVSAVDVILKIGAETQTISVDASVPLLQTETSAVAQVVENAAIVDMPLVDRRAAQLQRLNGFVVGSGTASTSTFATAGGRGNNGNYTIDGGNVQNILLGTPSLYFDPPTESLQEYNVAISNYDAELGRSGGAVVQMTTKSGTNQFHGSAYEYFRNDALQAIPYFAPEKAPLRYNLFGASIGGPIVKNKTLFFFNYEGLRWTTSTAEVLNVPTLAEDAGNFSADSYQVVNPATGLPFFGNIIPATSQDPVGAQIAAFFPAPNVPGAPSGKANFAANDPSHTKTNTYVARVDQNFSEKDRIFGRFLADPGQVITGTVFPTPGIDPFGNLNNTYYYNASATWFHNFTPTLINELRATYSQRENVNISAGANSNIDQKIGLTGTNQAFAPTVVVNGFQTLGNPSLQQRLQVPFIGDEIVDNLSWQHGKHQVKFGFEYRYNINVDRYSPTAGGDFTFTNKVTGSSLASLLLGRVYSASLQENESLHSRANSYGAFIQDDWRVTPNFTLNVGLRYDLDSPRWETHDRQNSFDPTAINPVSGTPGIITFAGVNGVGKYSNNWDWNNFGPRVGFAWKVKPDTVLRAGGGVLYTGEYDEATPIDASAGFSLRGSYSSPDNGITPAFYLQNGLPPITLPTAADLTPGFGAVPVGQNPTTAVDFLQPHHSNGYIYQTSLDIQHEIAKDFVFDVTYVGTFGHRLPSPTHENINQVPTNLLGPGNTQILRPFPQFSNVELDAADQGNSNYNALNAGLEKRYSYGLQFKANYTWSKFIDNQDANAELANYPGTNSFTNYYTPQDRRGLSGNDVRNRFVIGTVYELPAGRGRLWAPTSGTIDQIVGGWSTGVIAELHTGTPLSPIELNNNTASYSDGVRPNLVANPNLAHPTIAEWFNTAAFVSPAQYTFGDAPRTFGEGPGLISVDASLLKDFRVTERTGLQFRAEALNVINHANFANPNTTNGGKTFGEITSLVPGNTSRIIQVALHLTF
jgi:Carboxypeptidase regulatory-like domain/TonB dependent receptor